MSLKRNLVFALMLFPACSERVPELPQPSKATTPPSVAPDDLTEGRMVAFGLRLPLGASVKRKTPSSSSFEVPASYWATTKYVEGRLALDGSEKAPRKASFTGKASEDGPRIQVVVRATSLITELIVRVDPLPESADLTMAEPPEREAPLSEYEAPLPLN